MTKRFCCVLFGALLLACPAAASIMDSGDGGWPKPTKLASMVIEVDPSSGVNYAEVVGDESLMQKSYGTCTNQVTLDLVPTCPTCNNCPAPDPSSVNEIVVACFQFHEGFAGQMVRPTAGQKYGFEVINLTLSGSAVSSTHEIICPQAAPGAGYEFGDLMHCAVVFNVEVNSCSTFWLSFDICGTVD